MSKTHVLAREFAVFATLLPTMLWVGAGWLVIKLTARTCLLRRVLITIGVTTYIALPHFFFPRMGPEITLASFPLALMSVCLIWRFTDNT